MRPVSFLAFFPLALAALLMTTSCRSIMDPTPMPAGYAYHQEKFKSPPGPPAEEIGYPFSVPRNDVVVEKWQAVAASMVDKMEGQLGVDPQPVYIEMLPRPNAFNTSLDYVLREELRLRGYTLMPTPGRFLHLKPEAWIPGDEKVPVDANRFNGDVEVLVVPVERDKAHKFVISVAVLDKGYLKGTVSDTYSLPAYGYKRGDSMDRTENKELWLNPKKPVPQAAPDYKEPTAAPVELQDEPAPLVPVSQEPI
jgi:hypothetical protein